jgi:RNA polymerase sigma-70 factor (ECF subfamily)
MHIIEPLSYGQLGRLNDEQLMVRLQAGDNDALALLFDRYHRLVLSIALKIVRDRGEAEDVVQNVFLDIFRTVAQFDPSKGTTKVWLLQYAYHRALNRKKHLQVKNFYTQVELEEAAPLLFDRVPSLNRLTQLELKRLLEQALATLGPEQKRVIELASHQGLSMQEISDKTGESLVNVRHHYYRGLKKLRSVVLGAEEKRKKAVGDV